MVASPNKIDWAVFGEAIAHYEKLGYKHIEVPWMVDQMAVKSTLPEHVKLKLSDDRTNLVGSAEQSFIQMMIDGTLLEGKYQAISPCFRKERIYDELHQHHFMKLELIDFSKSSIKKLGQMVQDADDFFRPRVYLNDLERVINEEGIDIEYNGIELGSYGCRLRRFNSKYFEWTYGTGVAEPRFSFARKTSGG